MTTSQSYQTFDPWTSHPPTHEHHWQRLTFSDIASMDETAIRDEITALDSERARRATVRRLDRWNAGRPGRLWMLEESPLELDWMQERIDRLKGELRRRPRRVQ